MIPGPQGSLLAGGDLLRAILDGSFHRSGLSDVPVLSNGGLTYTQATNTAASAGATVGLSSGQRYFECNLDVVGSLGDNSFMGVMDASGVGIAYVTYAGGAGGINGYVNDGNGGIVYSAFSWDGHWEFKFNLNSETVTVSKAGTTVFSRSLGAHGALYPFFGRYSTNSRSVDTATFNFGASTWAYDPGAGWTGWAREV